LTYSWDFSGAAAASVQQNPKVQFNTPGGPYAVKLTVRDAKGLADATPASVSVTVTATKQAPPATPPIGPATSLVSAVLPASRAVQVGSPLTVYATMINSGSAVGTACSIGLGSSIPATLGYQATNSATNTLTGSANTPVDIEPGAAQSFVVSLTPSAAFSPTDVQLRFSCANAGPAGVLTGINTLLLSASNTATPDVIALVASTTRDGIANIPGASGTGAFAVASANVGSAGSITATADTGSTALPVNLTLCQTDPSTGACLQPPAGSVSTAIANGGTPTFAVFVRGTGAAIPFDPAGNRIYVRFRDNSNAVRGASSVAVRTQ
jgi:PKD repeat protein